MSDSTVSEQSPKSKELHNSVHPIVRACTESPYYELGHRSTSQEADGYSLGCNGYLQHSSGTSGEH